MKHLHLATTLMVGLLPTGCSGNEGPTQPPGNAAPTATITAPSGDRTIQLGAAVDFQGSANDSDGQIVAHAWDFDDGTGSSAADPGPHTFSAVGVYTVTYQVTDDEGAISAPDDVVITVQPGPVAEVELGTTVVASGLSRPVYLTSPPGDPRLFIVQQSGSIRAVENGQLLARPFLDLSGQVSGGNEQGLLSMAFHPDYANNGFFYVNFTDNGGTTRIVRYTVSAGDPNLADAGSALTILSVPQPFGNHNGGHLLFGADGMLYIPLGDGGSGGDPDNRAQDTSTLLGSLLRIDVDGGAPYTIPTDNPFAAGQGGARPEIWAYGLRNPWRVAFDRSEDVLYVADVGQNSIEEVNAVDASAAPVNYGWRIMEGSQCFNPASGCDQSGLTLPVIEYTHSEGCAITGGYVYRGAAIPDLVGHYFYADYCSGFLRSFRLSGGNATQRREWDVGDLGNVSSFGEDAAGELYVLDHGGTVYRLIQTN